MEDAYGRFSYRYVPKGNDLVFIAGGFGVTPMLSMLRQLSKTEPHRNVALFWGAKDKANLICLRELEQISQIMENFIFVPALSRAVDSNYRNGHIDETLLKDVLRQMSVSSDRPPSDKPPIDRVDFFFADPLQ